jgi:phage replication-related protein YjqB (UPF0714/DUF867 family)
MHSTTRSTRSTILALPGALALALILALTLGAVPASAACDATTNHGVGNVGITLITQPFSGHTTTPSYTNKTVRREHAYISSGLAALLGISSGDVDADWRNPNPQIRVWLEVPTYMNNWSESKKEYRLRESSAMFTVVGIRSDSRLRVWIYRDSSTNSTKAEGNSGHYKVFAKDYRGANDEAIRYATDFGDYDADGIMDTAQARVFAEPAFSSTLDNQIVGTEICEPDDFGGFLRESAVNQNDNRLALLIPHGGDIETGTSDQIAPFRAVLEDPNDGIADIPVNYWDLQGEWKDVQTYHRWHITATNLTDDGFPALQGMLNQTQYDPGAGKAFRYALAFHGFGDNTQYKVILGGQADRDARCLVAKRIRDEVGSSPTLVFSIPQSSSTGSLDGMSDDNIVNRLAADGGIQLEQSKKLRDDATVRDAAARGAAKAVRELLTTGVPAGFCAANNL